MTMVRGTKIHIRYSLENNAPQLLDLGELAYSFAANGGGKLFIGNSSSQPIVIGGRYYTDYIDSLSTYMSKHYSQDITGQQVFDGVLFPDLFIGSSESSKSISDYINDKITLNSNLGITAGGVTSIINLCTETLSINAGSNTVITSDPDNNEITVGVDTNTVALKSELASATTAINASIFELGTSLNTNISTTNTNLASVKDELETAIDTAKSGAISESNTYTDNKINALGSVYSIAGSCTWQELINNKSATRGQVYNITDNDGDDSNISGQNYVCIEDTSENSYGADHWDSIGGIFDMTPFTNLQTELSLTNNRVNELERTDYVYTNSQQVISNKTISNSILSGCRLVGKTF